VIEVEASMEEDRGGVGLLQALERLQREKRRIVAEAEADAGNGAAPGARLEAVESGIDDVLLKLRGDVSFTCSSCFVYIGLADDRHFKWEGGDPNGNTPYRISPNYDTGLNVFDYFVRGGSPFEFVQLDWGAFGAKATKAELKAFFADFEGLVRQCPYFVQLAGIDQFLDMLWDDEVFALIVGEY
jgi:hypothetical protein